MNQEAEGKLWLKFYDEGIPATMDYPSVPLDQLLADSAAAHPENTATIFGMKVMVCSLIWVAAWKMLINRPVASEASRSGPAVSMATSRA